VQLVVQGWMHVIDTNDIFVLRIRTKTSLCCKKKSNQVLLHNICPRYMQSYARLKLSTCGYLAMLQSSQCLKYDAHTIIIGRYTSGS